MKRGQITAGSAWAVVTGAGSGIGRCYAVRLARLGYNVLLVGRRIPPLQEVVREIDQVDGVAAMFVSMDLARLEAAQELYDFTQAHGLNVDVLVNNAGIFSFCDIVKTPSARIEQGVLLHDLTETQLCRLFAADMIKRGARGYILNMSSYVVWMYLPGFALYSATKAYLKTFSIAFSHEVREHGVRVTAVCPAGVATDLYGLPPKLQRLGIKLGILITADRCARNGLRALWRGRKFIAPPAWTRLSIPFLKHLPGFVRRPMRKVTMKLQK